MGPQTGPGPTLGVTRISGQQAETKAPLGRQELGKPELRSRMRGKRRSLWLGPQGSQDSRERRRDRKKGNYTKHIL